MTIVVIPAKDPDARLVTLVDDVHSLDHRLRLIVVDDGSRRGQAAFGEVAERGATVLRHGTNLGKGEALKTAMLHARAVAPDDAIVTADCDGQHTAIDIVRVARAVERDGGLVLGTRAFDASTPLRSRFGNACATLLVRTATGVTLADTQTGLRGIAPTEIPWAVEVPGSGFEYELEMLLAATEQHTAIEQLPIQTVYLDHNASSHFRPVRDSVRVIAPLIRFAGSSLVAAVLDVVLLAVLVALTGALVPSIVVARVVSAATNFVINRRYVFASTGSLRREIAGYAALAAVLLGANIAAMTLLTGLGLGLLVAKAITETALWCASFAVQRLLVFRRRRAARATAHPPTAPPIPTGATRA